MSLVGSILFDCLGDAYVDHLVAAQPVQRTSKDPAAKAAGVGVVVLEPPSRTPEGAGSDDATETQSPLLKTSRGSKTIRPSRIGFDVSDDDPHVRKSKFGLTPIAIPKMGTSDDGSSGAGSP